MAAPSTPNVLRLEIQYLDPPMPEGVLSLAVDYAPVVIKGTNFLDA